MPTLADIAREYAADPSAWPVQPCFDPERRWYHRIFSAGDHEAWLLTWLPGQGTDLHDHGGSAGAFVVLRGELTEATVAGRHGLVAAGSARLVERRLAAGTTRPFGPAHVHRVRNAGAVPAVSLHVYAPALARMRRYELLDGTLRLAELELAGRDW
jgi:predicted metal-dependent enzyme (double-stranded beta helix superfamily)